MGWVSCLEDVSKKLDGIINYIQGLSTNVNDPIWHDLRQISRTAQELRRELDELIEEGTDSKISPIIELRELKEAYESMRLEHQDLQVQLSEEKEKTLSNFQENQDLSKQLIEISKSCQTEQDISENLANKYYNLNKKYDEEKQRREKAEAELERLKSVGKSQTNSNKKNLKRK